jgi:hypothetical protein
MKWYSYIPKRVLQYKSKRQVMPLSEEGRSCEYNADNSIARHWKVSWTPFTHLPFSQPALPKTSFNLISNSVFFQDFPCDCFSRNNYCIKGRYRNVIFFFQEEDLPSHVTEYLTWKEINEPLYYRKFYIEQIRLHVNAGIHKCLRRNSNRQFKSLNNRKTVRPSFPVVIVDFEYTAVMWNLNEWITMTARLVRVRKRRRDVHLDLRYWCVSAVSVVTFT